MKRKALIIVLSILFVIFSSLSVIGYIEHNKDNKNSINDDNKVVDNEENNIKDETNDDNNVEDETDDDKNNSKGEYIEEKELFIYFDKENDRFIIETYKFNGLEYEYIDSYKCIKDSCKYLSDKNILVIYDDNKVLYKDLNKKEDFKEATVEKTYEYYDKYEEEDINIKYYNILNNYYFVINDSSFRKEHDYDADFDHSTLEDGYVLTYEWREDGLYAIIYDINKKAEVVSKRLSDGDYVSFMKKGEFYIYKQGCQIKNHYIYTSSFELVLEGEYIVNRIDYYIKDDIIYYIDNNEGIWQLSVKDKDNNKIDYPNKNMQPQFIYNSYLLYLEEDNSIKIKDLSNDKIVVDSNLKFNEKDFWNFYVENDYFYVEYLDDSVKGTKEWKNALKRYIEKYEHAIIGQDIERGYRLIFNQNNELVKKEVAVLEYLIW